MNRTLKTMLIWLLMAVLPLNAVAAAIGASCGPMHQNMHQGAELAHDAHDAPHAAAQHGHADASLAGIDLPTAPETAAIDGDTAHSCSACSPFCIGAVAPPPALIAPPPPGGSEIVTPSPAPLIAGFIPDGQKRPPRHLFA